MLPMIPKPAITRKQKRAAMAVAAMVDFLQVVFLPLLLPGYLIDDFLDLIAAFILTGICGFKWQFAIAFSLELVPVLDLLPTWTAVVLTLPVSDDLNVKAARVVDPVYPPLEVSATVVTPPKSA